jgi:hypothetical protein
MDRDFWSGVSLVINGLVDAAAKASFSLALGAGSFGGALVGLERASITGFSMVLLALSAFFMAARLGKALDENFDSKRLKFKESAALKVARLIALTRAFAETDSERDKQDIMREINYMAHELDNLLDMKSTVRNRLYLPKK